MLSTEVTVELSMVESYRDSVCQLIVGYLKNESDIVQTPLPFSNKGG